MSFAELLLRFDQVLFRLLYTGMRPPGDEIWPAVDRLFMVANVLGEYFLLLPAVLALWWAARGDKAQFAAWLVVFALGLGLSSAALALGKQGLDRSRPAAVFTEPAVPVEEHEVRHWRMSAPEEAERAPWLRSFLNVPFHLDQPERRLFYRFSFPSGHAQMAFALAAAFAAWFPFLRIPLFSWATLTALSRIYGGHHFPFDVVAGAILGWAGMALVFALLALLLRTHPPAPSAQGEAGKQPAEKSPAWRQWLARAAAAPVPAEVRRQRLLRHVALLGLVLAYPLALLGLVTLAPVLPSGLGVGLAAMVAPLYAALYLFAAYRYKRRSDRRSDESHQQPTPV